MKLLILSALGLGLLSFSASAQQAQMKTEVDSVSYSIGHQIGGNLKQQSISVNTALVAKGIEDAINGSTAMLTPQQMEAVMMAFQQKLMAQHQERMNQAAGKNKKEGDAFLAENKKKKGVVTLPSGLQYEVISEGKGKMPKATDQVTVHYKGTLVDGTVFDSSIERGEPATFPLNGVIRGWTEGLQLMKEGSKWRFFIPSDLAYGQNPPQGSPIGPNAVLIFDVELLSVK